MTDQAALYVCEPPCTPAECDCPAKPREAKPPEWYDEVAIDHDSPHLLENPLSPWNALYVQAALLVRRHPNSEVIDIGCGTGRFAALIDPARGTTRRYLGVDFSERMLQEARRYTAERHDQTQCVFVPFDAREPAGIRAFSADDTALYVMLEVLEHLDDDLALLYALPENSRVIVSVPSTDSTSHVRSFPNGHDAIERYDGAITIESWQRVWTPEKRGFWHLMTGVTPVGG